MALTNPRFSPSQRLQLASNNNPAMKKGERGHAVRLVQQSLIDLGFRLPISIRTHGSPDGKFGNETRTGVRDFQRAQLIKRDGIVGKNTLTALDGALPSFPALVPALPAPAKFIVPGTKSPLAQPSNLTCWATAFTIMRSWKDGKSYAIGPLLDTLGTKYGNLFKNNLPLPYSETNAFLSTAGLKAAPLRSYPAESWIQLLRSYGLLFVGSLTQPGTGAGHVRILYGVGGSGDLSTTTMMVLDPDGGRDYQETFERWSATYFGDALASIRDANRRSGRPNAQIGYFPTSISWDSVTARL